MVFLGDLEQKGAPCSTTVASQECPCMMDTVGIATVSWDECAQAAPL